MNFHCFNIAFPLYLCTEYRSIASVFCCFLRDRTHLFYQRQPKQMPLAIHELHPHHCFIFPRNSNLDSFLLHPHTHMVVQKAPVLSYTCRTKNNRLLRLPLVFSMLYPNIFILLFSSILPTFSRLFSCCPAKTWQNNGFYCDFLFLPFINDRIALFCIGRQTDQAFAVQDQETEKRVKFMKYQDVIPGQAENTIICTVNIKDSTDMDKTLSIFRDFCDRIHPMVHSMRIRYPYGHYEFAMGIGARACADAH